MDGVRWLHARNKRGSYRSVNLNFYSLEEAVERITKGSRHTQPLRGHLTWWVA